MHLVYVATALLVTRSPHLARADLVFSAGFSDDAVLQRTTSSDGAMVYGFTDSLQDKVAVSVSGIDGAGKAVSYKLNAQVTAWTGGTDIHPNTPPPPPHGNFVWRAALQPAAAGGSLTISASNGGVNGTATITRVTHGDVWFCSGQSNVRAASQVLSWVVAKAIQWSAC